MNELMFNNTPARKQIDYWVSEQSRCMKWLLVVYEVMSASFLLLSEWSL